MDYDFSWECPHVPTDEIDWQESDWYAFFDEEVGVGGVMRIGQKPNQNVGQTDGFVFARDGMRWVHNESWAKVRPISKADRWSTGYRVETHLSEAISDEVKHFKWSEPDCTGDLTLHDAFYPPRAWRKGVPTETFQKFMKVMQSGGKLQSGGRISGTVTIGAKSYTINALMHRDRAWGVRDWTKFTLYRYRLISGTVGPSLSFATATLDLLSGERPVMGYVVRDGVEEEVVDLKMSPLIDSDGYSVLAATARLTLDSGEVIKLETTSVQTVMSSVQPVLTDSISTLEYNGQRGFAVVSVGNNPGRGSYIPTPEDLTTTALAPGLSPSVPNPF